MKTSKTNTEGLTLIELLIAMVIMVMLGGGFLGLQYIISQNQQVAINNYYNVDGANVNLNSMIRELRTAKTSEIGSFPIEVATEDELIFFSDIDFDGDVDRIRYTRTGNELEKGTIEPEGQPLSYIQANEKIKIISSAVRNDTTPLFTYYNGDWPADTENNPLGASPSLAHIKLIRIYLQINENVDNPREDYVLDSYITLRMLKDNL